MGSLRHFGESHGYASESSAPVVREQVEFVSEQRQIAIEFVYEFWAAMAERMGMMRVRG